MRINRVFVFALLMMLVMGSCNADKREITEPTPRDVRILISGNATGRTKHTLLQIVDDNVLDVTVFYRDTNFWIPNDVLEDYLRDAGLLETFGLIPHMIDDIFANSEYLSEIIENNKPKDITIFDNSLIGDFVDKDNKIVISSIQYDDEHWVAESAMRNLSQRQLRNIWKLAENVANNDFDEERRLGGSHINFVWVIIDGEMYWGLYHPDISTIRHEGSSYYAEKCTQDLLYLTYYLMDLSPIKMGFEQIGK
jgi:hypothetical protein